MVNQQTSSRMEWRLGTMLPTRLEDDKPLASLAKESNSAARDECPDEQRQGLEHSERPEFPSVRWSQDLLGFDGNIVAPLSDNGRREQPERTKTNGDSNQWHCDSFLSACAPH